MYLCFMRVRDEQKIELVHAATLNLVARIGLAGLTISMIAKEAGVAAGTIYIYFKNKEDPDPGSIQRDEKALSLKGIYRL